jgi:hypothetical protein
MSSDFLFFLADMVLHLSKHLENSEKLTEASGCFFLCSSLQVCTKNEYNDILPLGFLGFPLPLFILPQRGTELSRSCLALTCPGTVSVELSVL